MINRYLKIVDSLKNLPDPKQNTNISLQNKVNFKLILQFFLYSCSHRPIPYHTFKRRMPVVGIRPWKQDHLTERMQRDVQLKIIQKDHRIQHVICIILFSNANENISVLIT